LTEGERERADAMLVRILAAPVGEPVGTETERPSRRRRRVLTAIGLLGAAAVAAPTALGGSAFASWTATPAPLPPSTAAAAATTCRAALPMRDQGARVVIGERRGGWTYVLLEGPGGEGACLMADDLVGAPGVADSKTGFFGSYDPDPPDAPTSPPDGIVETQSAAGTVSLPRRFSLGTVDGWFTWVTGYAGSDVTRVTVHPPVGPDVEASLHDGRFSAWWPAGEARGDNPGVSGAWTYTVTLADGTTRQADPQQ
jgi:hypothetical protein